MAFLILLAKQQVGMHPMTARKAIPAALACLLLAGLVTGNVGASTQTQAQLSALVSAAQSSKAYAYSTVDLALAHGLSVGAAQAQLSQGDSLLAAAQADAQSGKVASGIQAAQAAMSAYTSASTSASVALNQAGLTGYVDYSAALGAIAQVNATSSIVASAAAQACGSAGSGASNSTAFAQACAQIGTQIGNASLHFEQAAALLAQSGGRAGADANLTQAFSLIASARAEVNAAQSDLATVASFTYVQRGRAFVEAVLLPLSAKANATISAEQSFRANLTQFWYSYDAYALAQSEAASNVTTSASALAEAISMVNVTLTSSSIASAQTVAASVEADMSALLAIPGITALPSVVTDIDACSSAAASYNSSLTAVEATNAAYSQTQLQSFSGYLSVMNADASTVQANGAAYSSACQKVITDLSALFSIQGVQAIYSNLVSLDLSGSAGGVNSSLELEISAMAAVQSDFATESQVVASSQSKILTVSVLLSDAQSLQAEGAAYLNATAYAALANGATSVQDASADAQDFVASANSSLSVAVGAFAYSVVTLSNARSSLESATHDCVSSIDTASAYVNSDTQSRISAAASGQAEMSHALQLFSSLDVSGGAAALAQATLELQAASAVSV